MADVICAGLTVLWTARTSATSPVPGGVHPESLRLYFSETTVKNPVRESVEGSVSAMDTASALTAAVNGTALVAVHIFELVNLRNENSELRVQNQRLRLSNERLEAELKALQESALGRAVTSAKSVPALSVALEQFRAHMRSLQNSRYAKQIIAVADAFVAALPPDVKTLAGVRVDHVAGYLDRVVQASGTRKPAAYRRHLRINLGRLLNWSAHRWEHPSPMAGVAAVPKNAVERDRGDIHWHALAEVEAVLAGMPSDAWFDYKKIADDAAAAPTRAALRTYWRALVATLAYAGLQLAELAWLRREDVEIRGDRGQIWVTTVQDNEDPKVSHSLKTLHRKRQVDIHSRLLMPRLKAYVETASEFYLFPMPKETRRRKREIAGGSEERWIVGTLSTTCAGIWAAHVKRNDLRHRRSCRLG